MSSFAALIKWQFINWHFEQQPLTGSGGRVHHTTWLASHFELFEFGVDEGQSAGSRLALSANHGRSPETLTCASSKTQNVLDTPGHVLDTSQQRELVAMPQGVP